MEPSLTPRQQETLQAIVSFRDRNGRTPSGPELARVLGVSTPRSAYRHLQALEQKGYITIGRDSTRQLRLQLSALAKAALNIGWRQLGTIPAGPLAEAVSDDDIVIETVQDLIPVIRQGDFFLEVDGDSMVEAGLEPGMTVVVRPTPSPKPGAICAVWVDGEGGTLKRVFPEALGVRLEPANSDFQAQWFPADQVRIQGVVIAALFIRTYA